MKAKFIALFCVITALAALAFSGNDATKIRWQPKAGDTAKYAVVDIVETPFGTKVKHEYKTTAIVEKITDGKVILKFTSTEPKITADVGERHDLGSCG